MARQVQYRGLRHFTNAILSLNTLKYVAWGTGGSVPAGRAATNLTTNAPETRTTAVTGANSRVTTAQTNDTYRVIGTVTRSAARTVNEVGVGDGATVASWNMCLYSDHGAQILRTGDSIQYTIDTQFT